LAIDADPNSCLAENLGFAKAESIVGTCEDISKNMDKIPSGMTKERFIGMKVQEAVEEADDFDLLVMGRPEGPGCYCYVNNLLRDMTSKLTTSYDFVVIDNAAGMEHISRRTMRQTCTLVLVSDYSIIGVRSTKRIYELAKEIGIKIDGAYLVLNKVSGPVSAELRKEIDASELELAGTLPYNEELVKWSISSKPIFDFSDKTIKDGIEGIFNKIMERKKCR